MKRLNKDIIKQLVLEAVGSNPARATQSSKIFAPTLGAERIRNFTSGERPDNSKKETQFKKSPYETGPVKTHIKDGETYVTQGKNQYRLVFTNDDLSAGYIEPMGQYGFYIHEGMLEWNDSSPANVMNDSNLEEQILDYSGREK